MHSNKDTWESCSIEWVNSSRARRVLLTSVASIIETKLENIYFILLYYSNAFVELITWFYHLLIPGNLLILFEVWRSLRRVWRVERHWAIGYARSTTKWMRNSASRSSTTHVFSSAGAPVPQTPPPALAVRSCSSPMQGIWNSSTTLAINPSKINVLLIQYKQIVEQLFLSKAFISFQ